MNREIKLRDLTAAPGQRREGMAAIPGLARPIPAVLLNGSRPGPTVLVTAGVHGCETVGVAAALRLAETLRPEELAGAVVILSPVNASGFWARRTAVVPEDGLNLNRLFPAAEEDSPARRLAAFLEREAFPLADYYVDLHSGNMYEDLTPYVYYAAEADPRTAELGRQMAMVMDVPWRVPSRATSGTFNRAAALGIPALLLERGCAGRWTEAEVEADLRDVLALLRWAGVLPREEEPVRRPQGSLDPVTYLSPEAEGLWFPAIRPGDRVEKGQLLGRLLDHFGRETARFTADHPGVVLYMTGTLPYEKGISDLMAYGCPASEEDR